MKNVAKLFKVIQQYGEITVGNTYTNKNGIPYRYDTYKIPADKIQKWMIPTFYEAVYEVKGNRYEADFMEGNISFYLDRPKFKGMPMKSISATILLKF